MKNKALEEMEPLLKKHWGDEVGKAVKEFADRRLLQLCSENKSDCKAARKHTEQDIFPCISIYEGLQKNGINKTEALEFLDKSWSDRAKKGAESMRKILKIAGLYKLYPAIFQWVARNQFGTKAGFHAKFYDYGKKRCKFDMTQCLFLDTCKKYGCPELTQCFCHVDDINNDGLHPQLCWNRTQYMGGGGEFCDFDIFVTEKR